MSGALARAILCMVYHAACVAGILWWEFCIDETCVLRDERQQRQTVGGSIFPNDPPQFEEDAEQYNHRLARPGSFCEAGRWVQNYSFFGRQMAWKLSLEDCYLWPWLNGKSR